jgi:ATP-dependent protease HslVU (ClpYQ) peptidase subunit
MDSDLEIEKDLLMQMVKEMEIETDWHLEKYLHSEKVMVIVKD